MANNPYQPCVYVVPEDDANRQVMDGFVLEVRVTGQIQVMPVAGGWRKVIEVIEVEYCPILRRYPKASVLGLIDCDDHATRIGDQLARVPEDLKDRVFLLGVLQNPEALRANLEQNFETIGESLAEECATETTVEPRPTPARRRRSRASENNLATDSISARLNFDGEVGTDRLGVPAR